jgi:hypothetical protein
VAYEASLVGWWIEKDLHWWISEADWEKEHPKPIQPQKIETKPAPPPPPYPIEFDQGEAIQSNPEGAKKFDQIFEQCKQHKKLREDHLIALIERMIHIFVIDVNITEEKFTLFISFISDCKKIVNTQTFLTDNNNSYYSYSIDNTKKINNYDEAINFYYEMYNDTQEINNYPYDKEKVIAVINKYISGNHIKQKCFNSESMYNNLFNTIFNNIIKILSQFENDTLFILQIEEKLDFIKDLENIFNTLQYFGQIKFAVWLAELHRMDSTTTNILYKHDSLIKTIGIIRDILHFINNHKDVMINEMKHKHQFKKFLSKIQSNYDIFKQLLEDNNSSDYKVFQYLFIKIFELNENEGIQNISEYISIDNISVISDGLNWPDF